DRSSDVWLMSADARSNDGPALTPFSPWKTPNIAVYSFQLGRVEEGRLEPRATLTDTGRTRISGANCPRWPGLTGGGSLGPETALFWAGQHHRTPSQFEALSIQRQIARSAENYP